ncbi:PREDICTED: uncharacterized protein LOC106820801 [Priapulus caudatus]|uniref:Uncharacterized protein LOC106820801 n=1 Tax=Priapulus caudatus TaxID=37621 RepID=A0ABM1F8T5_PRICU|nr:PREDICTED: uncharacterized protein LOC106820801 [Priapulus caudatus]
MSTKHLVVGFGTVALATLLGVITFSTHGTSVRIAAYGLTDTRFSQPNEESIYYSIPQTCTECCQHEPLPWIDSKIAPRAITQVQYWKIMSLMNLVDMVFKENKVPYFVFGGALYGSYMCHDLLPWDDDIDIVVKVGERRHAEKLLLSLAPEYTVTNHTDKKYDKFHLKSTPKKWKYAWSWPFIDISFYDENSTHVWEHHMRKTPHRVYPRAMVFPLHQRPYGPYMFPSPRDTLGFLKHSINGSNDNKKVFTCGNQGWRHQAETSFKKKLVPCTEIMKEYPHVHRRKAPEGGAVTETLMLNGRAVYSCVIAEPDHLITNGAYSFELEPLTSSTKTNIPIKIAARS